MHSLSLSLTHTHLLCSSIALIPSPFYPCSFLCLRLFISFYSPPSVPLFSFSLFLMKFQLFHGEREERKERAGIFFYPSTTIWKKIAATLSEQEARCPSSCCAACCNYGVAQLKSEAFALFFQIGSGIFYAPAPSGWWLCSISSHHPAIS